MLNRIQPAGSVNEYRTFSISAPLSTHFRAATCEEAGCEAYQHGWLTRTVNDEQADYIRRHSGRSFTEDERGVFVFAPGQTCFAASHHRVRIERDELCVVRDGDWRGNPTGKTRTHTKPEFWVEEFAEHQDFLKTIQERG